MVSADPGLSLEAHYLLDEKYPQTPAPDPHAVAAWIEAILAQRLADTSASSAHDLLSHQGGGPGGGEWNSSADLLLVLSGPRPHHPEATTLLVTLNREPLPAPTSALRCTETRCLSTLVVDAATWQARLRPVTAADQGLLGAGAAHLSPGDLGQILVVEATGTWGEGSDIRLSRAFSIAFGE